MFLKFFNNHVPFLTWKLLIFVMISLNLWLVLPEEYMKPNGQIFQMILLFIMSHFLGIISGVCRLPPLFGMLVAGFLHGNLFDAELDSTLSSTARSLALIIILTRAGLNLDPQAIRSLSAVCAKLSLLPSAVEAAVIALFAWFWFDFTLSWSLMLGFIFASVSPAVVVPSLVAIQEKNYGVKHGIPTLLIASASVDNICAITGVTVCLGFAFNSTGDDLNINQMLMTIARNLLEVLAAIICGLIVGIVLWYIPQRYDDRKADPKAYEIHRFLLLTTCSLFIWFGSQRFDLNSIGPLAILIAPFVASIRWRINDYGQFTRESLRILWVVFEVFLFSLIGSSVRLKELNTSILTGGLIIICIAATLRMIVAYMITFGHFNNKERLFMSIAWFPKATIQAAMGPIAVDLARTEQDMKRAQIVLTLAVLSILVTAPIGAILLDRTYAKLLNHDDNNNYTEDDVEQQRQQQSLTKMAPTIEKLTNKKTNTPLLLNDEPIHDYSSFQ